MPGKPGLYQLQLLMQGEGIVTIAQGAVPVIDAGNPNTPHIGEVAMIVNFLRSGCPAVQFTSAFCANLEDFKRRLKESLDKLALKGENFLFSSQDDSEPYVTTITREIAPEPE